MLNGFTFDCSLFNQDYPELANQIAQVCQIVGIPNLSNIKIPWAQAKAFANKKGKLFSLLYEWNTRLMSHKKDVYFNLHVKSIESYITDSASYNSFYANLKFSLDQLEDSNDRINRVYYGLGGGISWG